MGEKQSSLYLISGVVIGILIGLIYTIVIDPVTYVDTQPTSMNEESKSHFRILVAKAYQANGDLGRANARLDLLSDGNPISMLSVQAQNIIATGGNMEDARQLALLANDLQNGVSSIQMSSNLNENIAGASSTPEIKATGGETEQAPETGETSGATHEPEYTFTPRVTRTSVPTLSSPFKMEYGDMTCEKEQPEGLLQVEILDKDGNPVPGIKIEVTWQGGSDYFYTGLYPEINPGYADFKMESGTVYSLRIENSTEVVDTIEPPLCDGGKDEDYYGGWWYRFIQ